MGLLKTKIEPATDIDNIQVVQNTHGEKRDDAQLETAVQQQHRVDAATEKSLIWKLDTRLVPLVMGLCKS